jgi:hypothetical protein
VLHAFLYFEHIERTEQNRQLMARIALNVTGNSPDFPVPLRELDKLSPKNRAITAGFLKWCEYNEQYCFGHGPLSALSFYARGELN